ncbi:tRNA(Ile)-lysidine synthase [Sphingomonas antarctica]|uniref:tRNA lysidine(34) synthetase TilS n=1 Tax=Sphingomonas antarctica TaxID=2040274 RepID=UPI0039EBFEF6
MTVPSHPGEATRPQPSGGGQSTATTEEHPRLALAISGGPDSVAMLLLAHAAFPGRVEAATCDHRLRPESAAEARFVANLCAERGVPHATLNLDLPATGNVSNNARQARYAALEDWRATRGLTHILTAHHADDQLETVIMRLNRGAGVGGLAGIRAVNGHVVRPLLGWRRSELAQIVSDAAITPVDDPSNRDDRYDRARLRKMLADADWLDPLAVSRSAAACAEADDALNGVDDRELTRRSVLAELRAVEPNLTPRGDQLDALIAALETGRTTTLGNVLCTGGNEWRFTLAPPRKSRRHSL